MTPQISEISAEMLLGRLYPELEDRWTAHHDGTFYRNYSRDVMEVEPEIAEVWLSRDSILGLLPQGLISTEDELRTGDKSEKHKELEMRKKLLSEAFLPIDTFTFRRSLKVERNVSELLEGKLEYILKTYFDVDLQDEKNPYVREFAVLLPCIRNRRGDFQLIRRLLSDVFGCEVTMQERRYSATDSTRQWLPSIRYELLVPELTAESYREMLLDVKPLEAFLGEWFVPMEVRLEIEIKQHHALRPLDGGLTLDYNTEL